MGEGSEVRVVEQMGVGVWSDSALLSARPVKRSDGSPAKNVFVLFCLVDGAPPEITEESPDSEQPKDITAHIEKYMAPMQVISSLRSKPVSTTEAAKREEL